MASSRLVLPSPFEPDDDREAVGIGLELGGLVVPEVREPEAGDPHRRAALSW